MIYSLFIAGVLGSFVATVHGLLMEKHIVVPLLRSESGISPIATKLVRPLLQFTTFAWFMGGACLVYQSLGEPPIETDTVNVFVAAMYLYGAIFNLVGTKAKHPGGYLLLVCVCLIGFSMQN